MMPARNKSIIALKVFAVAAGLAMVAGCASHRHTESGPSVRNGGAKYVFLLIGDGMGNAHVHAAEIYRAAVAQRDTEIISPGVDHLAMSRLPVHGMCTTYSVNRQTTDSAAAGTALATGFKTDNGMISMTPDGKSRVTIAEQAKARGMKVGIISDVPANHATPAVFYAHQKSRGQYHEIAMQIAGSCLDVLAGSSLPGQGRINQEAVDAATEAGFTYVTTRQQLNAARPGDRVLAIYPDMTFVTDRAEGAMSLAELTRKTIELLDTPKGFFIMVEAGRIDWSGHANDAKAVVDEVMAFDDVVAEAMAFYRKHPEETLVVVTSDHETGGMTLASIGERSEIGIASLADQQTTYNRFNEDIFAPWKAEHTWTGVEDNVPADLKQQVQRVFGFAWDELSPAQADLLEAAYDRSMGGAEAGPAMYGKREAFPVAIGHVMSQRAGIGWTTFGHSPVTVPVFAEGAGSRQFSGAMDNTDIARRMARAMGLELSPN